MSDRETATVDQVIDGEATDETQLQTPAEPMTSVEPAAALSEAAQVESPVAEAVSAQSEPLAEEIDPAAVKGTSEEALSSILDLSPGQYLTGKVKNTTEFGAFVDVGLPQDGLVHISELSRKKVDKVTDVVSVGQEIEVWVKKVDSMRGRISLTMVKPIKRRIRDIEEGDDLEGVVTRLESYGAFIDIDSERDGLVHISQISHDYIEKPEDGLTVGERVKVKVLKVNKKKRQIDLSIKALVEPPPKPVKPERVPIPEPEPEPVVEAVGPQDEASMPTAMAVAFSSLQGKGKAERSDQADNVNKGKKEKQALSDLLSQMASQE
jgi:predicted RNA-binding protein with RPS1 domain